jgi:hypothetical protein
LEKIPSEIFEDWKNIGWAESPGYLGYERGRTRTEEGKEGEGKKRRRRWEKGGEVKGGRIEKEGEEEERRGQERGGGRGRKQKPHHPCQIAQHPKPSLVDPP